MMCSVVCHEFGYYRSITRRNKSHESTLIYSRACGLPPCLHELLPKRTSARAVFAVIQRAAHEVKPEDHVFPTRVSVLERFDRLSDTVGMAAGLLS